MDDSRLALIDAARGGMPGAVIELIRVCQPDVRRFARRTCATSEDAEDAVQVALWRLYRHIGALRTAATLAAWLFRIVERECYRLFRRRIDAESLHGISEAQMPAAITVPIDLRLDLAKAVENLPGLYRDVLILRDVQELTAPEVAQLLGISVDAVKSRLHRAHAQVRARLMASGYWLKDGVPETHVPE